MPTGGGTGGASGGRISHEDMLKQEAANHTREAAAAGETPAQRITRYAGAHSETGTTKAGQNTYNQMRGEGFSHQDALSGAKGVDANPHEFPGGANGSPVETLRRSGAGYVQSAASKAIQQQTIRKLTR